MIFYFAGPYPNRKVIAEYAATLTLDTKHKVRARWLAEGEEDPHQHEVYAAQDLNDVEGADAVAIFVDGVKKSKGGMWVEFGAAMQLGKPVYIIGKHQYHNIFCWLADNHYDTFEDFKEAMCD